MNSYLLLGALVTAAMLVAYGLSLRQRNRLKKEVAELSDAKTRAENATAAARIEAKAQADLLLKQNIQRYKDKFNNDNVHLISQALIGQTTKSLQEGIRSAVEQKFNRTGQEFLGSLSDEAEGIIRDLNIELCEKIWDAFQAFKELSNNRESPQIFPDGCKVAYTKGNFTVRANDQISSRRHPFCG
jgi:outer membrane murein-binding lipoprotein Lpp